MGVTGVMNPVVLGLLINHAGAPMKSVSATQDLAPQEAEGSVLLPILRNPPHTIRTSSGEAGRPSWCPATSYPKGHIMARRARGEGTIFRRKDGRWQGAVTLGFDTNGKQTRRTVYGKSQREVRDKIDQIKRRGAKIESKLSLEAYLGTWLEHKRHQVKPRTAESYDFTIQRYIIPRLGRHRIDRITPLQLQRALTEIAAEVSPTTSNYCRAILYAAFRQALRWCITSTNPIDGVDRMHTPQREMTLWSVEQTNAFLTAAREDRLYPMFHLALATGMRVGEILGLQWDDLEGDTLHVRRSLNVEAGRPTLAEPKTNRGRRSIALDPDTVTILEEHRQRQAQERQLLGEAWEHPSHMFTTEIGTYLDHSNVRRVWNRIQEKANVPHARLHDARHLHVSLLIHHGIDTRTIADRIGHSNPAFTLRQYAHVLAGRQRAAAIPLAELLQPPMQPSAPKPDQPVAPQEAVTTPDELDDDTLTDGLDREPDHGPFGPAVRALRARGEEWKKSIARGTRAERHRVPRQADTVTAWPTTRRPQPPY